MSEVVCHAIYYFIFIEILYDHERSWMVLSRYWQVPTKILLRSWKSCHLQDLDKIQTRSLQDLAGILHHFFQKLSMKSWQYLDRNLTRSGQLLKQSYLSKMFARFWQLNDRSKIWKFCQEFGKPWSCWKSQQSTLHGKILPLGTTNWLTYLQST